MNNPKDFEFYYYKRDLKRKESKVAKQNQSKF